MKLIYCVGQYNIVNKIICELYTQGINYRPMNDLVINFKRIDDALFKQQMP